MLVYAKKTKYQDFLKMRYPFACIAILAIIAGIFNWEIYLQLALALILSSMVLSIYTIYCHVSYFKEHPLKYYHAFFIHKRTKSLILYFTGLLISLAVTIFCFAEFTIGDFSEIGIFSGFAFFVLVFCFPSFIEDINYVAIYPYFEKSVGDIHTYGSGISIARRINLLDNIAKEANLQAISSFGYKDNWKNKRLEWYNAKEVLPTITGLLDMIKKKPDIVDDSANITNELGKIYNAITKAEELDIKCCFVMNFSGYTNGLEHEKREGSFF